MLFSTFLEQARNNLKIVTWCSRPIHSVEDKDDGGAILTLQNGAVIHLTKDDVFYAIQANNTTMIVPDEKNKENQHDSSLRWCQHCHGLTENDKLYPHACGSCGAPRTLV